MSKPNFSLGELFENGLKYKAAIGRLVASCNPHGIRVWNNSECLTANAESHYDVRVYNQFLMVVDYRIVEVKADDEDEEESDYYFTEVLLEIIGPDEISGWISSWDVTFHAS